MKIKKMVSLFFLALYFSVFSGYAAQLQSLKITETKTGVSVLFSLDKRSSQKIFTLSNPNRLVIDFANTKLAFSSKQLHIPNQKIQSIRAGYPKPQNLRLVFEIPNLASFAIVPLKSSSKSQQVFALNITAMAYSPAKVQAIPKKPVPILPLTTVAKPPVSTKPISSVAVKSQSNKLSDVIVVIDPGHGGKDPGAIGPHRQMEKNITLEIAHRLKQRIDKEPGMRAVLTRSGDKYIALRERLHIARQHNAHVFVSIHADAFIHKESNGASVFALSQSGATSEAARWLAEKENYSELGGVNLRGLDDQSGLVRTVLIDLSQTATIAASLLMGKNVLNHLQQMTHLHNHRVEQARFMVLKSPDIPSILIETGFISNPVEARNLSNARYQDRMVHSIFQGLKAYFHDYPPHGSRLEAALR